MSKGTNEHLVLNNFTSCVITVVPYVWVSGQTIMSKEWTCSGHSTDKWNRSEIKLRTEDASQISGETSSSKPQSSWLQINSARYHDLDDQAHSQICQRWWNQIIVKIVSRVPHRIMKALSLCDLDITKANLFKKSNVPKSQKTAPQV